MLAYVRVAGIVLLGFLPILIITFVLIAFNARKRKIS